MNKIINPGKIDVYGNGRKSNIFCKIETRETPAGLELSISGVVGPRRSGNCAGPCGQIIMDFKEYDRLGYDTLADITPALGWSADLLKKFFDVWDRWHRNGMNAGCEHQEAAIRETGLADTIIYPNSLYEAVRSTPLGHCEICDYDYGSAWKFEAVPADVLDFLSNLPDTKITPAWV